MKLIAAFIAILYSWPAIALIILFGAVAIVLIVYFFAREIPTQLSEELRGIATLFTELFSAIGKLFHQLASALWRIWGLLFALQWKVQFNIGHFARTVRGVLLVATFYLCAELAFALVNGLRLELPELYARLTAALGSKLPELYAIVVKGMKMKPSSGQSKIVIGPLQIIGEQKEHHQHNSRKSKAQNYNQTRHFR